MSKVTAANGYQHVLEKDVSVFIKGTLALSHKREGVPEWYRRTGEEIMAKLDECKLTPMQRGKDHARAKG